MASKWEEGRYNFSYLSLGHFRASLSWKTTGRYELGFADTRCEIVAMSIAEARPKAEAIIRRMLTAALEMLPAAEPVK